MADSQVECYISSGDGELRAALEIFDDHRVIRSARKTFYVHSANPGDAKDFQLVSVSTLVGAPIIGSGGCPQGDMQNSPFSLSQWHLATPSTCKQSGHSNAEAAFAFDFEYQDLVICGPTRLESGPEHRLFSAFVAGRELFFDFSLQGKRGAASLRLRIDKVCDKRTKASESIWST
jgi:hypothetical protein